MIIDWGTDERYSQVQYRYAGAQAWNYGGGLLVFGDLLCGSVMVEPLLTGVSSVSPLLVGETTVTPLLTGDVEISVC